MTAPLQIRRHAYPQEPAIFAFDKTTPPEKETLLTRPATVERFSHESDQSAVDSALQVFKQHQQNFLLEPWTSIQLTPTQYTRFLGQLEHHPTLFNYAENNIRFDYDPVYMLLSIRMPTPVHDFFTTSIANEISRQLEVISQRGDTSAEFAAKIISGASARIFLREDNTDEDSQDKRIVRRREPDAQFQHRDAEYPGVVLEISYSQDGKDIKKLAWDYILYSNGDIKVVIGIDIKYSSTKEATLSVWRPHYVHEDGEDLDVLEVKETIISQPFRAADGSFDNSAEILCLNLNEFATDEVSMDLGDSVEISISYEKLAQLLNMAEEIQASREPTQGSTSAKSKRRTRKRRRSSTPLNQLRSEDEVEYQNQEAKTQERIDAADEDFNSTVVIHGQSQRRQKPREA